MKRLVFLLAVLPAFCQLTTPSTTLSTAVPLSGTTQWCVASASSVIVPNTSTGANGSYFLVDREVAQVTGAGISSTCFKVRRGQMGTSASASHTAASKVWIGQPATSSGDPSRPFNGAFITSVPSGSCVATDQYTLPLLYAGSISNGAAPGSQFTCIAGAWQNSALLGRTTLLGRLQVQGNLPLPDARGWMEMSFDTTADSGNGAGGWETYQANSTTAALMRWVALNHIWYTGTVATQRWEMLASDGSFVPVTTDVVDIGTTARKVKKVYLSNCTSGASPAVCGAATVGAVAVAAAATTLTVATTAVTAKSRIVLTMDSSLGTDLSVTCNTANIAAWVSARTAATSFVITTASGPVTTPMCLSYQIFN